MLFLHTKAINNGMVMVIGREKEQEAAGVRKGQRGWEEEGENEKRGLFTKNETKKIVSCLKLLSHRTSKKLQTIFLSPSVSVHPTSPTPRHTACTHPEAKRSLTHTGIPRGQRMRSFVTKKISLLSSYGSIWLKIDLGNLEEIKYVTVTKTS